jgi:hypothetical protein
MEVGFGDGIVGFGGPTGVSSTVVTVGDIVLPGVRVDRLAVICVEVPIPASRGRPFPERTYPTRIANKHDSIARPTINPIIQNKRVFLPLSGESSIY